MELSVVWSAVVNTSYYKSPLQFIASTWLLISSVLIFAYALANPIAEWDMLAYAASAEALDNPDAENIHDTVYSELRARTTDEEFYALTASNSYRTVMYQDSNAFYEQLPYYSIRITYNSLLAGIKDFGVSVYDAGYWITASAFVLALLVLWGSTNDRVHPLIQLLLPIVFYKYTKDLDVVRHMLADSLAAVWVVFMCVAYMRDSRLLLFLVATSVLVRVDLFIFSSLLLALMYLTDGKRLFFPLTLCSVFLVGSFLAIQSWAGSYGWSTLYYFAIISDMSATHPSVYGDTAFTLKDYLNTLFVPGRWVSNMFVVTALFSTIILVGWKRIPMNQFNRRVCRISLVCTLYIAAHYLIFPQMYLRFFVAQNLVIFTGFAVLCTHCWYAYAEGRDPHPDGHQELSHSR